ncbi:TetR/AcrR family transcriptional regulator [Dyella humi]|uniref:TetR/AcrR family transcriptional regulator n=1 Tax=Dyella humi TaxID=1770547 RepID=A0ABW8IFR8_9GAMM
MEQNRARIVDAATNLFRQHGVAAVGVADIMKAAGMTQGGFYKHFPSKDALAAEACTVAFTRSVDVWKEKAKTESDGGTAALRELVTYYFAPKSPERTCPMVALSQDAAASDAPDDPLRIAYSQGAHRLFDAFAEVAATHTGAPMSREKVMMIFAAMVGANFLTRAIGEDPWMVEMKSLVLSSIDTKQL